MPFGWIILYESFKTKLIKKNNKVLKSCYLNRPAPPGAWHHQTVGFADLKEGFHPEAG